MLQHPTAASCCCAHTLEYEAACHERSCEFYCLRIIRHDAQPCLLSLRTGIGYFRGGHSSPSSPSGCSRPKVGDGAATLAGVAVSAPHAGPSHRVSAMCESPGDAVNYPRVGCGYRRGSTTRTITNPGPDDAFTSVRGRMIPAEWARIRGRNHPRTGWMSTIGSGRVRSRSKCTDRRYTPSTA
jgi:hypothetical protein